MVLGQVFGQERTAGAGRPFCRQAGLTVLGTGEFVERRIEEADAELQLQVPLEARVERRRSIL
jgi:hypothetical protein